MTIILRMILLLFITPRSQLTEWFIFHKRATKRRQQQQIQLVVHIKENIIWTWSVTFAKPQLNKNEFQIAFQFTWFFRIVKRKKYDQTFPPSKFFFSLAPESPTLANYVEQSLNAIHWELTRRWIPTICWLLLTECKSKRTLRE